MAEQALAEHWNGEYYLSMINDGADPASTIPGYDPNIDIVQAWIYGALPCTDTKMLATAARLRGPLDGPVLTQGLPDQPERRRTRSRSDARALSR